MSSRDSVTSALAAMSAELHRLAPERHSVTSPLGLWLLLATAGVDAEPAAAQELHSVLGLPVREAAELARSLLARPHPAVMSAIAVWSDPDFETPTFQSWSRTLGGLADTGALPTQSAADEWARRRTGGLVSHFPARIDADTMLVLASALATRVTWSLPFELVQPATAAGTWPAQVTAVLQSPQWGRRFVIGDRLSGIGDVAVHDARSPDLSVVSVAAHPDRSQEDVLRAAHRIAAALVPAWAPPEQLAVRSLFDLELGPQPCWDLREESGLVRSDSGREEVVEAFLPAWRAHTQVDLGQVRGVGTVAGALLRLLRPHPKGSAYDATQAAHAGYSRFGFSAAAVTAMTMAGGVEPEPRPGTIRTADLHFDLPHAVVATALDGRSEPERRAAPDPWEGLPVFSAWVTEAVDASPTSLREAPRG